MKFELPLLAVQDVEVSKKFYKELFEQEVVLDLGRNVTFSGGFAIQQDFAWLTDIDPDSVIRNSHNMELYFEVDDFDQAYQLHKEMGCICFENKAMGLYFINDPDDYWIEIIPKK